jgi:TonB family protein
MKHRETIKMKNPRSLTILFVVTLTALFGFGCKSSSKQSSSEEPNAKTKVSKENLKACLSGKKVKFIEKEGDEILERSGEVVVKERSPLTLKIVSVENEPNVEFNRRIYKLHILSRLAKDWGIDRLTLPATEADMKFYNDHGIAVEDFELVIRDLDESIKEFAIDFLGRQSQAEESPKSKTTGYSSLKDVIPQTKSELPKDDVPPPLASPPPSPMSDRPPVSGGDLTSRAISRFEPTYSPAARKVGVSGPVTVQIIMGEDGSVVSASAISGHPLLRSSAVAAVRQWRFTPTQVSGQSVRTSGTVTVNFTLQ